MNQYALFPSSLYLTRVAPERNMYRFYRLRIIPDLFGGCSLLREWGRIGSPGRIRCDHYLSEGHAVDALDALARGKQRRGYEMA